MTALTIRAMTIHDYDAVCALWTTTEGLCLSEDDSHDRIALFLARNPNLSFVAVMNGELVGSVLCGHDGRRGMLRHLAVKDTCRGQGIGRQLVAQTLKQLAKEGIQKCNLYVLDSNLSASQFWEYMGWKKLDADYRTLQKILAD